MSNNQQRSKQQIQTDISLLENEISNGDPIYRKLLESKLDELQKELKAAKQYDPEELKTMAGKKQNQLNNHDTINKDGKSTD